MIRNIVLATIALSISCGQDQEEVNDDFWGGKSESAYHFDTRVAEDLTPLNATSDNSKKGVFKGAYFNEAEDGNIMKLFKVKLPDSWPSAQLSLEVAEISKYSEMLNFSLWFVPDDATVYTRCVGGEDLGYSPFLGAAAQGCSVGSNGQVDIQSGCITSTSDTRLSACRNAANSGTLFVRVAPKKDPARPNSIFRITFDEPVEFEFALSASMKLSESSIDVAADPAVEEQKMDFSWGEGRKTFDVTHDGKQLTLYRINLSSTWPRRTMMSLSVYEMDRLDPLFDFAFWFVPASPGVHTACWGGTDLGFSPLFGVAAQGCRVYRTSNGYTNTVKRFGKASIQSGCVLSNTDMTLSECSFFGDRNHGSLYVAVSPKAGVSAGPAVPITFWIDVDDDEEPIYKIGR